MSEPNHHDNNGEKIIPLYEEKLRVERSRRKVSEIVIRKEIETDIVEVPLYREKLIVERVADGTTRLAEIAIGETRLTGDTGEARSIVTAEFTDLHLAAEALKSFARQERSGAPRVRVQLLFENESDRALYGAFLERWTKH
ncbi:DUF2382 domain-containing protein [Pannus brasiliensis CCIBt3594]|uniref:DUF2382 domain-containing protein n=1 Tax=Pannus brasiliensis CCIBt3594 TaxID=1427578 RepID=A0AAW9QQA3_9CHRO